MGRTQILFLGTRMLAFNKALILSLAPSWESWCWQRDRRVKAPVPLLVMISG